MEANYAFILSCPGMQEQRLFSFKIEYPPKGWRARSASRSRWFGSPDRQSADLRTLQATIGDPRRIVGARAQP